MNTKPFKKIIGDEAIIEDEKKIVKPFKKELKKDIDLSKDEEQIEKIIVNKNMKATIFRIGFFSTVNGIVLALIIFIFIAVVANTVDTISTILTRGNLSSWIYLSGLILLLIVLILNIISNFKQLKVIKNVKTVKEKFALQKDNPTDEIVPLANIILNYYSNSKDEKIIESINDIREELNTSQVYKEIYKDLDSRLLSIMDDKAKEVIRKASIQATLSTAISPFSLFDMLLVLWRSIYMTKEIAIIYGFKPGGLSTIILLKQAVINVVFAGVSELTTDLMNDFGSSTFLTKFSQSAGQGIANGILLARLGYGILEACRPIAKVEDRGSFITTIMHSILTVFKSKDAKL